MGKTNEQWHSVVNETMKIIRGKYPEISLSMEFGVYYAPENYFVAYIFSTDAKLSEAVESGLTARINADHKQVLKELGYPETALKDCSFDSQETCDREFSGNWYYFYK